MKKALAIVGLTAFLIGWCCSCKAEAPCDDACQTQRNIAALEKNTVMLEVAFTSIQPQNSCTFNWTFPKGVNPVRSQGFVFTKNHDGTITAWSACNPKFKEK